MNFEDFRWLLIEIRNLAGGSLHFAGEAIEDETVSAYFIALCAVIRRNSSCLLKFFDALESFPEVEKMKLEELGQKGISV